MVNVPFEFKEENVDNMPLIFLKLNNDGTIIYVNRFAETIMGYEVKELIGNKFYKVFTPNTALEKAKNDLAIISRGVPEGTTFNNWSRTKSGKHIYIEWRISYLEPPTQEVFDFLAYGVDLTQSFYNELMADAKANLAASLNLSTTIDQMLKRSIKSMADFALMEFGLVYKLNPKKREDSCKGWYAKDVKLGRNTRALYELTKEKRERLLNLNEEGENEPSLIVEPNSDPAAIGSHQLLYFFPFSNQEQYVFHFFYTPKENRPDEFITSFFDEIEELLFKAFERIKDKEKIEEARTQAERANKIKDSFVASVSHEIRTPLNAILGHAQMLQKEKLSKQANKSIAIINSSGNHLINLLNEVLNNASLESGNVKVSYSVFNLLTLILEVRDTFSLKFSEKGLDFNLAYSMALPQFIESDRDKIKQVLINLLSNAIKFTDKGFIKLSVDFKGDLITLKVSDTGSGIAKDQFTTIFKQFQKSRKHGNVDGIGLGLSITKRTINLLNGSIKVESELNQGSTFTVDLPYIKPSLENLRALNENSINQPVPKKIKLKGTSPSILVVDDHPPSLFIVSDLLEKLGFDLHLASSVDDAIEVTNSNKIDLIILDIVMPKKDGLTFLKYHKNKSSVSHIPVVIISGEANPDHIDRAMQIGAEGFISKPFDHGRLVSLIEELLKVEFDYDDTEDEKKYKNDLLKLLQNCDRNLIKKLQEFTDGGEVSALKEKIQADLNDEKLRNLLNDIIQDLNLEYLSMLLGLALKED